MFVCVDAPGYGVLRKTQTVCRAERLFIYRDTLSLEALEDDCCMLKIRDVEDSEPSPMNVSRLTVINSRGGKHVLSRVSADCKRYCNYDVQARRRSYMNKGCTSSGFELRLGSVCGCILRRDAECVNMRRWIMMLMDKTDIRGNRYVAIGKNPPMGHSFPWISLYTYR